MRNTNNLVFISLALATLCLCQSVFAATRPHLLLSLLEQHHQKLQQIDSGAFSSSSLSSSTNTPAPVYWPHAFSTRFYVTLIDFNIFAAPSALYFDDSVPGLRADYDVCPDNSTTSSCSFTSNATATYRISNNGASCCLSAPVGPLNYNWTATLAYQGPARAEGINVDHWAGGEPQHDYFNNPATNSGAFLLVKFIGETWAFDGEFKLGPQDNSLFAVPNDCFANC